MGRIKQVLCHSKLLRGSDRLIWIINQLHQITLLGLAEISANIHNPLIIQTFLYAASHFIHFVETTQMSVFWFCVLDLLFYLL